MSVMRMFGDGVRAGGDRVVAAAVASAASQATLFNATCTATVFTAALEAVRL